MLDTDSTGFLLTNAINKAQMWAVVACCDSSLLCTNEHVRHVLAGAAIPSFLVRTNKPYSPCKARALTESTADFSIRFEASGVPNHRLANPAE